MGGGTGKQPPLLSFATIGALFLISICSQNNMCGCVDVTPIEIPGLGTK